MKHNTPTNTQESTHLSVLIILLAMLISEDVVNHPTTHRYNGLQESGSGGWVNGL